MDERITDYLSSIDLKAVLILLQRLSASRELLCDTGCAFPIQNRVGREYG